MFKYWINRLRGRPTVQWVGQASALLYRENGRSIEIGVRLVDGNRVIDLDNIICWNDKPEDRLAYSERERIAEVVRRVAMSQWGYDIGICRSA